MFSLIFLKRFLDTYWKTEWHSVCRQFPLKSHQIGEGINPKWFGTSKTLWVRGTHNAFQSTVKPLCSMDRHCWTKQNGAVTKKLLSKKKKEISLRHTAIYVLLLCWNEEVTCKFSVCLEFTPLNAKIKDLEGSPKFYTQVILKNLDWEDGMNRVFYKVFGDRR